MLFRGYIGLRGLGFRLLYHGRSIIAEDAETRAAAHAAAAKNGGGRGGGGGEGEGG